MLAATATLTTGKLGNAFDFPGVSEYIDLGDRGDIGASESYAVSLWFNSDSISTTDYLIDMSDAVAGNPTWVLQTFTDSKLYFTVHDGVNPAVQVGTANSFSSSTWYHVVLLVDRSTDLIQIYVDGNLEGQASILGLGGFDNSQFSLGKRATTYYNGKIDDVATWKRVLTPTEISNLYNSGTGDTPENVANDYELYFPLDAHSSQFSFNSNGIGGAEGKLGGAFDFDGSSDYITTDGSFMTSVRTISWWVNADSVTSKYFWGQGTAQSYFDSLGRIVCLYDGGNQLITQNSFSTSTWYHVVCMADGASSKIYVNGVEQTLFSNTMSQSVWSAETSTLHIGTLAALVARQDGRLDDFAFYDRLLTPTEISNLYNSGNGATAKDIASDYIYSLPMDSLYDSSTNSHNLQSYNGPLLTVGKIGSAFDFDGSNDYMDMNFQMINENEFSFSFWVNPDNQAPGSTRYIFGSTQGGSRDLFFRQNAGGEVGFQVRTASGTKSITTPSTVPQDTWTHFVGTWKTNGDIILYMNGAQVGTDTVPNEVNDYSNDFYLGALSNSGGIASPFNGQIDEFGLWHRELTSAEVLALYNSGAGLEFPLTIGVMVDITSPTPSQSFTYDVENFNIEVTTDINATCKYEYLGTNTTFSTTGATTSHSTNFVMGPAINTTKNFDVKVYCADDAAQLEEGMGMVSFSQQQVPLELAIFVPMDQQEFDKDTNLITFHIETNYQAICEYLVYNMSSFVPFDNTNSNVHTTPYTAFFPDVSAYPTNFSCAGTIVNETVTGMVTFFLVEDQMFGEINGVISEGFTTVGTVTGETRKLFEGDLFTLAVVGALIIGVVSLIAILGTLISTQINSMGRRK